MQVDLLVCNYNTKDKLERLIRTLNDTSGSGRIPWKLYVADNGSSDGSFDMLRRNADKWRIESIFKNPNIGYSAAINSMAALSRSEVLCAVNSDTWFTNNHVNQAIESFKFNKNQAIMGPKQIDERGFVRHGGIFWDGNKQKNPIHRGWNEFDGYDQAYKDRLPCWTVSGSIYYVRRSVWDEMTEHPGYRSLYPRAQGAFLETFMYFEETFTSVFAEHLGYEVWYDGTIETAGHSWHASNNPGDNVHHFHKSKEIYRRTCNALGIHHEV